MFENYIYHSTPKLRKAMIPINELIKMENLNILNIYEGQRTLHEERLPEIIEHQEKNIKKYGQVLFINSITICDVLGHNNYMLIDGQHRFESAKSIYTKYRENFELGVDFIVVSNEQEVKHHFNIINKCVPVPLVYLSTESRVTNAIDILYSKYPDEFATLGKTAYRPKIDREHLKSTLLEYINNLRNSSNIDFFSYYNVDTPENLKNLLIELNNYLKNKGYKYIYKVTHPIYTNNNDKQKIRKNYNSVISGDKKLIFGIFKVINYNKIWENLEEYRL